MTQLAKSPVYCKTPVIVVWGEPHYGLHATLLRAPATSWEREMKTRTTGRCPVPKNRPPPYVQKTAWPESFLQHRDSLDLSSVPNRTEPWSKPPPQEAPKYRGFKLLLMFPRGLANQHPDIQQAIHPGAVRADEAGSLTSKLRLSTVEATPPTPAIRPKLAPAPGFSSYPAGLSQSFHLLGRMRVLAGGTAATETSR